jgi:hypothetical protein
VYKFTRRKSVDSNRQVGARTLEGRLQPLVPSVHRGFPNATVDSIATCSAYADGCGTQHFPEKRSQRFADLGFDRKRQSKGKPAATIRWPNVFAAFRRDAGDRARNRRDPAARSSKSLVRDVTTSRAPTDALSAVVQLAS